MVSHESSKFDSAGSIPALLNNGPQFILRRFNPRRAGRGAPAAEVLCIDDGGKCLLWMNERDIRLNIRDFGPHQGLLDAQEAYRRNVYFELQEA